VGALGPKQQKKSRYQVAYITYIASGRRLSYTPSVEHVCSWLKICETQPVSLANFPFSDYIMLTSEKIPGSPHFTVLQAMESCMGGAWE